MDMYLSDSIWTSLAPKSKVSGKPNRNRIPLGTWNLEKKSAHYRLHKTWHLVRCRVVIGEKETQLTYFSIL